MLELELLKSCLTLLQGRHERRELFFVESAWSYHEIRHCNLSIYIHLRDVDASIIQLMNPSHM
jgi:hypothetical protein